MATIRRISSGPLTGHSFIVDSRILVYVIKQARVIAGRGYQDMESKVRQLAQGPLLDFAPRRASSVSDGVLLPLETGGERLLEFSHLRGGGSSSCLQLLPSVLTRPLRLTLHPRTISDRAQARADRRALHSGARGGLLRRLLLLRGFAAAVPRPGSRYGRDRRPSPAPLRCSTRSHRPIVAPRAGRMQNGSW